MGHGAMGSVSVELLVDSIDPNQDAKGRASKKACGPLQRRARRRAFRRCVGHHSTTTPPLGAAPITHSTDHSRPPSPLQWNNRAWPWPNPCWDPDLDRLDRPSACALADRTPLTSPRLSRRCRGGPLSSPASRARTRNEDHGMNKTDLTTAFEQTSFLYGGNAQYIEQLYAKYLENPAAVQ